MNFYSLTVDIGKRKRFACGVIVKNYLTEQITCLQCGRTWQKEILVDKLIEFEIGLTNTYYPDLLGVMYLDLISKRVLEAFQDKGFLNFEFQRIPVRGVNKNPSPPPPPEYFRLLVHGQGALSKKSNIKLAAKCDACGYEKYVTPGKIYIDPSQKLFLDAHGWDGSDLFHVKEMPAVIFCTERVVELFTEEGFTGAVFEKVESI